MEWKELLDNALLACPYCKAGDIEATDDGGVDCHGCGATFGSRNGWPLLLRDEHLATALDGWDTIAARYDTFIPSSGFPVIDKPLIDCCQGDVLEVGCGNGRLMRLVDDRCRSLVGIDPAPSMCGLARQSGFRAITAAAEELPFPDAAFDRVISGWASMRYTDQDDAFPEVARVLRPGGWFVFTLWNFHADRLNDAVKFWARGRRAPSGDAEHFRHRDVSSIRRLKQKLAAAGLPLQRVLTTPYPNVLARVIRPAITYYHGSPWTRLGYHVIISCRKPDAPSSSEPETAGTAVP